MKRITLLSFVLVVACSSSYLSSRQEDSFLNAASIFRAQSVEYNKTDCGGCEPCVTMQRIMASAATSAGLLRTKPISEEVFETYAKGVRAADVEARTTTCSCAVDEVLCGSSQQVLALAVQQIDEVDRGHETEGAGMGFLKGLFKGLFGGKGKDKED